LAGKAVTADAFPVALREAARHAARDGAQLAMVLLERLVDRLGSAGRRAGEVHARMVSDRPRYRVGAALCGRPAVEGLTKRCA